MNSGVYKITNTMNGKFYIGSAANGFKARWQKHLSDLKLNKHCNRLLQAIYNKHGKDVFEFTIMARSPREYVVKLEQFFIDTQKPHYNIAPTAGNSLGIKRTDEYKAKLSKSRTGYKASDEFKEKCRVRMMGNTITKGSTISDEHKAKSSPLGRIHSDETKAKMSASGLARTYKHGDIQKAKISAIQCTNIYEILKISTGEVLIVDNLKIFARENRIKECGLHNTYRGHDCRGVNINQAGGYKVISKIQKSA